MRYLAATVVALLISSPTASANEYGLRSAVHSGGQSAYLGVHASLTWTDHFSGLGSPNAISAMVTALTHDSDPGGDQAGDTQTNNNIGDDCISDSGQRLIAFAEMHPVGSGVPGYSCDTGQYRYMSDSDTREFVAQRDDSCSTCWGGWIGTSKLTDRDILAGSVVEVRAMMEVRCPDCLNSPTYASINYGESTNWARASTTHSDPNQNWHVITGGSKCDFSNHHPACGIANHWIIGDLPDPFRIYWQTGGP